MKATGEITIEEGLTLNNPTMEISKVNYDWVNHTVDIECLFNEENALVKHSRSFTFSTDGGGELTTEDIIGFIKGSEILKNFK